MFEEFSAGYYVGRLYIEPYDGDHAVMDRDQHVAANKQVYATGESIGRLDHPLVMKIDDSYLPVFAADNVPTETLGLPGPVLEATHVDMSPTLTEVLVVNGERAAQLLKWTTSYTIQAPDPT